MCCGGCGDVLFVIVFSLFASLIHVSLNGGREGRGGTGPVSSKLVWPKLNGTVVGITGRLRVEGPGHQYHGVRRPAWWPSRIGIMLTD